MTETIYPLMPESFKPEILHCLSLKETLLLVQQYGSLQVAERIGYEEFVEVVKRLNNVPRSS